MSRKYDKNLIDYVKRSNPKGNFNENKPNKPEDKNKISNNNKNKTDTKKKKKSEEKPSEIAKKQVQKKK